MHSSSKMDAFFNAKKRKDDNQMHDFRLISQSIDKEELTLPAGLWILTILGIIGLILILVSRSKLDKSDPNRDEYFQDILTTSSISAILGAFAIVMTCSFLQNPYIKTYEGIFKVTDTSKSKLVNQNGDKVITISDQHHNQQIVPVENSDFKKNQKVRVKIKTTSQKAPTIKQSFTNKNKYQYSIQKKG